MESEKIEFEEAVAMDSEKHEHDKQWKKIRLRR